MTVATKTEAQNALNAARTKAQNASTRMAEVRRDTSLDDAGNNIESDAAAAHYQRCVRELEEAINDMARFEVSGDDE